MEKGNEKNMHIIYRDSIIRKIQNFFCKVENRTILRKKNGKRAESRRIRKLDSKKEGVKAFAFASLITKKWWSYWFIYFFLITNLSSSFFPYWLNFSCLQITFVLQVHLNGLVDITCFSTLGSSTTFFDFLDFRRIFFSEMGHKNIVYKNIFKDTRMSILYFLGLWSHHPLSRQVNKWE